MQQHNVWELPFAEAATLEAHTDFGSLALLPVERGGTPRLELARSCDNIDVQVDRLGDVVRVALDPQPAYAWFGGGRDCKAVLYVPADVRATVQTNAGHVKVRDLQGCELSISANAGKIDLVDVYGQMHLSADAGSVSGRGLGGSFNVDAQAGSVRLEILDLQPGEHRLRATLGSVRVELARGLDVSIETHTSMGSIRNHYPARLQAPARLVLSTEMGSVRVDEASVYRATSPPARSTRTEDRSPRPDQAQQPRPTRDDPELERILGMVEAGQLSAREADELLRAMGRV